MKKLTKVIGLALDNGSTIEEVKNELAKVFTELKSTRLEKIIRTESIRYGTLAEQTAREKSGVVKYKQWWIAVDEITCESCLKLHGKKDSFNFKI